MQGYPENFESSCPRSRDDLRWLDEKTRYSAFSEGWGLYAEYPLVPEFTDAYENKPLSRYGMLKGQVRRFELVHVFATCAVISNQVSSTLMRLLFSFDRGMRVEKTLMHANSRFSTLMQLFIGGYARIGPSIGHLITAFDRCYFISKHHALSEQGRMILAGPLRTV